MNYFKILGLVFGMMALLKPVYMHILPWDEYSFINKAYSEKRPKWVVWVSILGILLVAFTWYKYFTTEIPYSIVIAILFSLTIIKGLAFIFNYQQFYKWVAGMLSKENRKKIVMVDIGASIFGLVLIILSIVLY